MRLSMTSLVGPQLYCIYSGLLLQLVFLTDLFIYGSLSKIPFWLTVTAVWVFSVVSTSSCNDSGFFSSWYFTLELLPWNCRVAEQNVHKFKTFSRCKILQCCPHIMMGLVSTAVCLVRFCWWFRCAHEEKAAFRSKNGVLNKKAEGLFNLKGFKHLFSQNIVILLPCCSPYVIWPRWEED